MRFQGLAGPIGWRLLTNIYWIWANRMVAFMNIYEFLDITEGKKITWGGAAVSSSISKSVWEGQSISCYLSYLLALIRKTLANLMKLYFLIMFWYLQLGKRPSVHLESVEPPLHGGWGAEHDRMLCVCQRKREEHVFIFAALNWWPKENSSAGLFWRKTAYERK